MIKSFLITNSKNESLLLELTEPQRHNIVIKNVTGLGPETATINTTDIVNSDISIFNNARRNLRNIIFTFAFNHSNGIEEDRSSKIYNFFPLKSKIRIQCNTDVKSLWIEGYVEKDEPNIFSRDEEVVVSILCPDGLWKGIKQESYVLSGLSKFEFPFSNECTAYSFYAKWADAEAFTWDQVLEYGWTWDTLSNTIGKVSTLVNRYKRALQEKPINKDKVNTLVEEIYKNDYNNYSHVYPIN